MLPWTKSFLSVVAATIFLYLIFHSSTSSVNHQLSIIDKTSGESLQGNGNGYQGVPSQIAHYFPPPDPARRNYHEWNTQTLQQLYTCMALDNCGPNQTKVALLAAHWFEEAIVRGWRGGEGLWGLSMYKHLRALGYTTLFANSFAEALEQYRMFPDLVKVVVRNKAGECHEDPKCVKGPQNPSGIPAWKIFDFEFFVTHGAHYKASLMKGKWILSANPDNKDPSPTQYIGYSVEDDCHELPLVRLAYRSNQVWMLMKQLTHVYDSQFAWNRSYFALAATELGINFAGGWQIDQHYQWKPDVQGTMSDIEDRVHGVINLGKLNRTEFTKEVGMSKLMIGVGNPFGSPSPYTALCMGVPFLNPIRLWDKKDPWNKAAWQTQHPSLNRFDPPYVYHVHKGDWDSFIRVVRTASKTQIPSFIPKHMTEAAVQERVRNLMETDWRSQAAVLLEERLREVKEGKKAYVFEL